MKVSIDTRTLHPGDVYYALRGERLDGHDFVVAALQAGAGAAVIAADELARYPPSLHPRLRPVADPLASLQALAREHRRAWGGPLVAITGSAGKTTTKEMTAAVLATKLRVHEKPPATAITTSACRWRCSIWRRSMRSRSSRWA